MQIKSHVAYVKKVEACATVGYGAAFMAKRETLIATIPCGYGDCYPRLLTNKGRVLIKGHSAPVTGRVCMDQFMVDVTDIPETEVGDTATIFGKDGDDFISVDVIAEKAGTINYEIVCDINSRVSRVYMKNGEAESVFCYLPHE
jgi:alanine racemase